ncbi:MAG TPA: glycosyltransferase, partial [Candidatus Paceibacterota bacterium]|nr:glycosyltransferase [Candidatus Paceibacterota bacterium]
MICLFFIWPIRVIGRGRRPIFKGTAMRIGYDLRFSALSRMGTGVFAETTLLSLLQHCAPEEKIISIGEQPLEMSHPSLMQWRLPESTNELERRLLFDSVLGCCSVDLLFSPTGLAPLVKTCPCVITIHDIMFETHPEFFSDTLRLFLKRELTRSIRTADHIISVSKFTRDSLIQVFKVPEEKITAFSQPLRHCFREMPSPNDVASTLTNLGVERPYFFSLTNYSKHKNLQFVLEAFKQWLNHCPQSQHWLIIAGGGPSNSALTDLTAQLNEMRIAHKVKVFGNIDDNQLSSLMCSADAFLFPSLFEGWGLPPLEAICLDTPVLVSDCGALPESVGGAGYCLPLNVPIWVKALIEIVDRGLPQGIQHRMAERKKYLQSLTAQPLMEVLRRFSRSQLKNKAILSSGISGCTIVRNAVKLGYPLEASIESYMPICDEVWISWDPSSEDDTGALVKRLARRHPKIRLFESIWDLKNKDSGKELAIQTNKVFRQCSRRWTLYIQADEAVHENSHDKLLAIAQKDDAIGVSFMRRSFLKTLDREIVRHQVSGLLRMFRTGYGTSTGDAMQCELSGINGTVIEGEYELFNYSRLGATTEVSLRCNNLRKFYHDDAEIAALPVDLDTNLETRAFTRPHPRPIEALYRVSASASANATFDGFSIIIPSFNDVEYVTLLLQSLKRYSQWKHEIIIVSDGSDDESKSLLSKQDDVIFHYNTVNKGVCYTTNYAASLASKEWLFFVNSDMVVGPGWDVALKNHLQEKTVVSATCIEPGLVKVASVFHTLDCGQDAAQFRWDTFESAIDRLKEERTELGIQYPFAVSKTLWRQVDGLDEAFDPGPFSDPDLFYRFKLSGATFIRCRSSLLYHFSGVSFRRRTPNRWKNAEARNFALFVQKWGEEPRYVFGSDVQLSDRVLAQNHLRSLGNKRSSPFISVHIIANENDSLGFHFLKSCVHSLRDYADEIVVVNNGLAKEHLLFLKHEKIGLNIKIIDAVNVRSFATLRNIALEATAKHATHIHKIDSDEVYFTESLLSLKRSLRDCDAKVYAAKFVHFMIQPTHYESIQDKAVFFAKTSDLRWVGDTHEEVHNVETPSLIQCPLSFLHFGYCRPQWQTMLKWLRYASLQVGSVDCYKYEMVDGVKLPWFRGTRTPNTILESRRNALFQYSGPY